MTDVMSKEKRSRLMALVRGRNTRFELEILQLVSAELYPLGYRYRKHGRHVIGTPDIVFAKYKLAVFLDSDFWHGRDFDKWAHRLAPFWRQKIKRNIARDREVNQRLRREGWKVLRFGQKQIRERPSTVVARIRATLQLRMTQS